MKWAVIQRYCKMFLILPIRGYQKWISPCLGSNCRYQPTCSAYCIEAIEIHGCIKGFMLGMWRILRCHPFAAWGYDPVPEKGCWTNPKRRCTPWRVKRNARHMHNKRR